MTSTSDMNIIVGQGTAIKEVHNVRKMNLELSQQFIAQKTEDQKKKDKSEVVKSDKKDRIEADKDKEQKGGQKHNKRDAQDENQEDAFNLAEGNLINITV
ncbi:MAG: hypothetical protein KKH68_05740 [Proteobacteria bacterium]|nr:hypothetical protein [Pseudomonadota bacterium]